MLSKIIARQGLLALGLTIAVAVVLGGEVWTTANDPVVSQTTAKAVPFINIPLAAAGQNTTSLAGGIGQWQLLYLGYRSCPDICPTTLAYLSQEIRQLSPEVTKYRVVFISVDPKRDSPDQSDEFAKSFHPLFHGVSGQDSDLRELARQLGGTFDYQDLGSKAGYLVSHPAQIFVIDPSGKLQTTISPPFTPGSVSAYLTKVTRGRS